MIYIQTNCVKNQEYITIIIIFVTFLISLTKIKFHKNIILFYSFNQQTTI